MKDTLKNPSFYYIAVPVLAALWAVTAGFLLYPKSVQGWEDGKEEARKTQDMIDKLVILQPKRLTYKADENTKPEEFDFTKTVNDFAKVFSIPESNYNFSVRPESKKRGGRRVRSATLSIKSIDIEKLAQFISAMLLRWPDLNCERLSFEKVKNAKNQWTADISLTYYY